MKNRKAAKQIIKRAKKHPEQYTKEDVLYAKLYRRVTKQHESSEVGISDSRSGEDHSIHSESKQSKESE